MRQHPAACWSTPVDEKWTRRQEVEIFLVLAQPTNLNPPFLHCQRGGSRTNKEETRGTRNSDVRAGSGSGSCRNNSLVLLRKPRGGHAKVGIHPNHKHLGNSNLDPELSDLESSSRDPTIDTETGRSNDHLAFEFRTMPRLEGSGC